MKIITKCEEKCRKKFSFQIKKTNTKKKFAEKCGKNYNNKVKEKVQSKVQDFMDKSILKFWKMLQEIFSMNFKLFYLPEHNLI